MFSSCIVQRCVVSGLGDGGRSGVDGFGTNEYSDVFSDHGSPLDCVNDQSDVGDGYLVESLLGGSVVTGVTVSVLEHETKRPATLGWVFQASVDWNDWVGGTTQTRCEVDT